MNNNRRGFEVKPLSFYELQNINIEDINVGDYVVAKITALEKDQIILKIGETKAKMKYKDYDYSSVEKIKSVIGNMIGKNIYARVSKKKKDSVILNRKSVIYKTREYFSSHICSTICATVKAIREFGLFVDIGNGVISLVSCEELSKCIYYNLNNYFYVGQKIKVKILDYNHESGLFTLSRKEAYEPAVIPDGYYVIVTLAEYVNSNHDGFYIEYNPQTNGIMDVPKYMDENSLKSGDQVAVLIKNHTDKGLKCRFIHKI